MTVFAGDPVLAADINEALNRRVGTFEGTSDLTATSGTTEKLCDVVTATLKGGRKYCVSVYFPGNGTVAADRFLIRLRLGSTTAGTQVSYARYTVAALGNNDQVAFSYDYTPAADGSVSFCTTATRDAGTGTLTPKGAASQPRYIRIELATTA
jgi:hypothetical protein